MRCLGACFLAAWLAGCASVPDRARDVYGGWVVTREIVADVVESPEVPDDVVKALAAADAKASPAAEGLRIALVAYHRARLEGASEETLDLLLGTLRMALDDARAAVAAYEEAL